LQEAAQSYRRLGALAYLNDTIAALKAYLNSVDVWPDDIQVWNYLGHMYWRMDKLEQAIEAYSTVGHLSDSTYVPQVWTVITLGNLGIVHKTQGKLDKAVAMHEKAPEIDTELSRKDGMATTYGNLGRCTRVLVNLERARQSWILSADLYDAIISPNANRVHSLIRELDAN